MKTVIEKITPIREGEAVIVSLSLSDGVHEEKCKHEIATDLFLDMGFPLSSGDGIEISQDGYEEIIDASELTSAIKKGADLIGFAQNTKKSLVSKLLHKGFSKDISVRAADYLRKRRVYKRERTGGGAFCRSCRKTAVRTVTHTERAL